MTDTRHTHFQHADGTPDTVLAYDVTGAPELITKASLGGGGGSGGGFGGVLLGSATVSNNTTVDFIDGVNGVVFDGTYSMYGIRIIDLVPVVDDVNLYFRTTSNGGVSWDSGGDNYTWEFALRKLGDANGSKTGTNSFGLLATNCGNLVDESHNVYIRLYNVATGSAPLLDVHSIQTDNNPGTPEFGGWLFTGLTKRNAYANINGIQFFMSSGNISTGLIELYGIL